MVHIFYKLKVRIESYIYWKVIFPRAREDKIKDKILSRANIIFEPKCLILPELFLTSSLLHKEVEIPPPPGCDAGLL